MTISETASSLSEAITYPSVPLPENPNNGIEVRDLGKRFRIVTERSGRMSGFLMHRLMSRRHRRDLWALKDVSFDVAKGEILGIIGTNGAGKTTLLRAITGISPATVGDVRRLPRVAALLDLSAGFHPTLTGFENLFLTASILGLSRAELRARLPEIVAFAGIDGKYLDQPVRYYSSGMLTRLGFSLAIHTDPDVVLIDEVLAVGDAEFQTKSAQKLLEFHDQGKAMILVSHVVSIVDQFCTRAIWLHGGKVRMDGPAPEIVNEYRTFINSRIRKRVHIDALHDHEAEHALGSAELPVLAEFSDIKLTNEKGVTPDAFQTFGTMIIEATVTAKRPVHDADLLVGILFGTGVIVAEISARELGVDLGEVSGTRRMRITLEPLLLQKGRFFLELILCDREDPRLELGRSDNVWFAVDMPFLAKGPTCPAALQCEFEME